MADGSGIAVRRTAHRAPRMNATCEQFLGSLRRMCLDHLLILGERHLRRVVRAYVRSFNQRRSHQGIGQQCPAPTGLSRATRGPVQAVPLLGGLRHDYQRVA